MRAKRGTCRYCGDEIAWVITSKGRKMPLNPVPDPAGNVVVTSEVLAGRDAGTPVVLVLRQNEREQASQERYVAHAATCAGRRRPRSRG